MSSYNDSSVSAATSLTTLDTLPEQINGEHKLAEQSARAALAHALRIGELLACAKCNVEHGQWLPWIRENLIIGERQV